MLAPNILIVEDEVVTKNTLQQIFLAEGYKVYTAENEDTMLDFLAKHNIDLILMDINLPGKNGLTLAREILNSQNIPLIFLTGRDNEIDKILGLEIGANDYIVKPFNIRELTIRVRNLLLRTMRNPTINPTTINISKKYHFNGWELDSNQYSLISPNGEAIKLPRSEFKILALFCDNPRQIIRREDLLFTMTGRELKKNDRSVDVTIRRLRKHFENYPDALNFISTIHGEGYLFTADVE